MLTSAQDHAFEGGDICEVAAPGHSDVSVIGHEVVGWIKVDPAVIGQVHREPCMGGIRANQVLFSGRGKGLEIAADISHGQTHSAEATDSQMGKVLTVVQVSACKRETRQAAGHDINIFAVVENLSIVFWVNDGSGF